MELPNKKTPVAIGRMQSDEEMRKVPMQASNTDSLTNKIIAKEERWIINIPSTESNRTAVFVAVQGRAFNIPRDTPTEVPVSVVKILEDAKITVITMTARGNGSDAVVETKEHLVRRFPMSKEKAASKKETAEK